MNLRIGYQMAKKTVLATDMLSATPKKIFDVVGEVEVIVFGHIKDTVVADGGALTAEVGISGNTASLIAQTAEAVLIQGNMWATNTPANPLAMPASKLLSDGADIYFTTGTVDANAADGEIEMFCLWRALSADGKVKAA